jgi:hypothetical protein
VRCVLYLQLIILSVRGDVLVDSETLLVTDFVNLKIKSTQSFRCAYRGRVCIRVLIEVSAHTCMSICFCAVFLKKKKEIKFPSFKNCCMTCTLGTAHLVQVQLPVVHLSLE